MIPHVDLMEPIIKDAKLDVLINEIPLKRSQKVHRVAISNDYMVYMQEHEFDVTNETNPTSLPQAISSLNSLKWMSIMKYKLASMHKNQVWDLIVLPINSKLVGCKEVLKTKRNAWGQIKRYKARLIAKDYTQQEDINYREAFLLVTTKDLFQVVIALVA